MAKELDSTIREKLAKAFIVSEAQCDTFNKFYQETILPQMHKKFLAHMVAVVEDMINKKHREGNPPVARRYNIRLSDDASPIYCKSYTWCHSQGAAITYNSTYDQKEIRVFIAHELGHLLLEHQILLDDQTENNANLFAFCAISEKNDFYVNFHTNPTTKNLVYEHGDSDIINAMEISCPINTEKQKPDQSYKTV